LREQEWARRKSTCLWSSGPELSRRSVEMRRILKPNYALATPAELRAILTVRSRHTDVAIRSLLQQYGLPATGDKSALESRVQEWIILFNSNLDTSHPRSLSALRAKLNEAEASRKRDRDKGKDEMVSQMGTRDGMAKYVKDKKREFERLRKDIMDRDERRKLGNGADRPIEVD